MANQNLRKDTDKQGKRASPKKNVQKFFPRKSRKERNKFKKAENGNTNELILISAIVTSWKKNLTEIARLNPDIMALQEAKVTKAAKPAANRAAGSEKLSVIWGKPCDQLKKKRAKTRRQRLRGWVDKEALQFWPRTNWASWQEEWKEKRRVNCMSQQDT